MGVLRIVESTVIKKNEKPHFYLLPWQTYYAEPKHWNELDESQQEVVLRGMENELTQECIECYAKPKYTPDQMSAMMDALFWDLTIEQVETYAKTDYDFYQLHQIYIAVAQGLTNEQIQTFSDPKFTADEMKEKRRELTNKRNIAND